MIESLIDHCNDLIGKKFKRGRLFSDYNILDGDQGLIISESDSEAAITEDEKFRLSVPPVARAIMMLIADLDEAFLQVKNMGLVDKKRKI